MASKSGSCASLGPVFLRLCLGVFFTWSGLGLILDTARVQGSNITALAEMGIKPASKAEPASAPSKASHPTPKETSPQTKTGVTLQDVSNLHMVVNQGDGELEVSRAYVLALSLKQAAKSPEVDGKKRFALWPEAFAKGRWPVYTAYAVVSIQLIGGLLLLIGALTRVAAAALVLSTAVGLWLWQLGPAVQSGNTKLGFLPSYKTFDHQAWQGVLLPFTLMCAAAALVCVGSGAFGVDRVLFPRSGGSAPKPKAPPA